MKYQNSYLKVSIKYENDIWHTFIVYFYFYFMKFSTSSWMLKASSSAYTGFQIIFSIFTLVEEAKTDNCCAYLILRIPFGKK